MLFVWSTYSTFRLKKRYKLVVLTQLALENAFQAILYAFVATSQSGSTRASVVVGLVQGLDFSLAQIYELVGLTGEGDGDHFNNGRERGMYSKEDNGCVACS